METDNLAVMMIAHTEEVGGKEAEEVMQDNATQEAILKIRRI